MVVHTLYGQCAPTVFKVSCCFPCALTVERPCNKNPKNQKNKQKTKYKQTTKQYKKSTNRNPFFGWVLWMLPRFHNIFPNYSLFFLVYISCQFCNLTKIVSLIILFWKNIFEFSYSQIFHRFPFVIRIKMKNPRFLPSWRY